MVQAVCFDLDDTLFDYGQYVRSGFRDAADDVESRTGVDVYDDLVAAYFEDGVRSRTFDHVLDARDLSVPVDPLVEAFHRRAGDLSPYEGAEDVLADLGRDYGLALVTDGQNGREKLESLGLADAFDTVFVAHDHDTSKRDPATFERVLSTLDADPAKAVHVGDNPVADFPAANELGMHTVRLFRGRYRDDVADPGAQADIHVDSLAELPPVVRALDVY